MKLFDTLMKKKQKGQVLVILALTVVGLVAIIGMAIDTGYLYVSYSRLARAVDAAGLAATGEFKRTNANLSDNIAWAAIQMLQLNEIVPDPASGFSDPTTGTPGVKVETCITTPTDQALCPETGKTPKKLVRITVQEKVPLFFLAVVPNFPRSFPIKISSIAQAASLDVILLIDSSESMAWHKADGSNISGAMRDPKTCNESDPLGSDGYVGDCHPYQEVKAAAINFIDQLYFPYDRVGVVTFNQYAKVNLPLSDQYTDIKTAIQDLTIFEGMGRCQYNRDTVPHFNDPWNQAPVPPDPYVSVDDIWASCRMFDTEGGGFLYMDCPLAYGPTPIMGWCGNTNTGLGFLTAGNALAGAYPNGTCSVCPEVREDAVWVVIILSDGAANSGFDVSNTPICPSYTQTWDYFDNQLGQPCRDLDATEAGRHDKDNPIYDADDYARDMADFVANNQAFIFSIAMQGSDLTRPTWVGDPPAQALLKYAARIGSDRPTDLTNEDQYFESPTASELSKIFLTIANKIATRINQ